MNGQHVKLVKLAREILCGTTTRMRTSCFLVVEGRFTMEFRDRSVSVEAGEFIIVPRGVEHRPVAEEEAHVLLFEPASTLNTGNVRDGRTVEEFG